MAVCFEVRPHCKPYTLNLNPKPAHMPLPSESIEVFFEVLSRVLCRRFKVTGGVFGTARNRMEWGLWFKLMFFWFRVGT